MATDKSGDGRSRRFPLWAKIIGGLVVIVLLVALAAPYFLDVDRYRTSIAAAIELQTGRAVTLGKIRARFVPEIGFVVQDFHLGNPKGFAPGDLVSAEEIRGNLALGPLLQRKIHLNSLELVGTKITLTTDENEKNNYTFASPASSAAKTSKSTSESDSGVQLDEIDAIHLTNTEVLLNSVSRGKNVMSADAKGINVTLSNFIITPVIVHQWHAESKLSGVTLAVGGWNAPIAFRSGQLTLAGGKLDAQFVADLAKASDIKGTVSVPDVEKAQVNFEMSASKLDLDALMAAAGSSPNSAPSSSKSPETPSEPNALVARGHINIEKVTSKPYTVGPANAEIRVYGNRAELWPITVGMYGGTLQVSSRVDRVTNPARFTANVQMRGLNMAKLLEESSAKGKMSGTGEIDLQLLGSLSDSWKKSLSGSGKFAVRNGTLPGINLSSAGQSLAKLTGGSGDTPFTVLQGDINIADQRMSSKQIHLDSTAGVVDLRGSVSLEGALDYQGQVAMNPSGIVGGNSAIGGLVGGLIGSRVGKITVPIAISGTIDNPKVQPGKGVPNFSAPATASGTATSPGQPATTQNPAESIINLFKKR